MSLYLFTITETPSGDGLGLLEAINEVSPDAKYQRYTVHFTILNKIKF